MTPEVLSIISPFLSAHLEGKTVVIPAASIPSSDTSPNAAYSLAANFLRQNARAVQITYDCIAQPRPASFDRQCLEEFFKLIGKANEEVFSVTELQSREADTHFIGWEVTRKAIS